VSEHGVSWDEEDAHDAVPWLELAEGQTRLDVAERLAQAHLSAEPPRSSGTAEGRAAREKRDRRRHPRTAASS
jgi:hypothetical protein